MVLSYPRQNLNSKCNFFFFISKQNGQYNWNILKLIKIRSFYIRIELLKKYIYLVTQNYSVLPTIWNKLTEHIVNRFILRWASTSEALDFDKNTSLHMVTKVKSQNCSLPQRLVTGGRAEITQPVKKKKKSPGCVMTHYAWGKNRAVWWHIKPGVKNAKFRYSQQTSRLNLKLGSEHTRVCFERSSREHGSLKL